jgi:isocitrate dehydrogenase kinase/phosphatase
MSLGFYKHGKTEFYRNYIAHVAASKDNFELAPGIKGLVMAVFHLPSYGVVFKVIKDEFAESKKITREYVKDRYRLVKTSDRVGRMADTHEYMNFSFPLDRFDPSLLKYLQDTCASSIEIKGNELILNHLYIERRMIPLNLYLRDETDETKIRHAIDELGLCIKQIALTNIFPGDMLHKNFGITKHGRVIFYDYDEICYMNERNFRAIPQSDDPFAVDTLSVGPNDVFPEQFEHFIVGKKHLKDCLKELHGDLMTPEYWKQLQEVCKEGKTLNFTPYNPSKSFFYEPGKKKNAYL